MSHLLATHGMVLGVVVRRGLKLEGEQFLAKLREPPAPPPQPDIVQLKPGAMGMWIDLKEAFKLLRRKFSK